MPHVPIVFAQEHLCVVVVLRRGLHVGKVKAPEHRPFCWGYNESFANRLGVDVEGNSDRIH